MLWLANLNPAFAPVPRAVRRRAARRARPPTRRHRGAARLLRDAPALRPRRAEPGRHAARARARLARLARRASSRSSASAGPRCSATLLTRLLAGLDVLQGGGARALAALPPAVPAGVAARRCGDSSAGAIPRFRGAGEPEYERFSPDRDWMPRVVLLAKNTYVWLDQLSQQLRPRHHAARPDPGRGAGHARALGLHRPVADRRCGSAAAPRSASSSCAAIPRRSPRPTRCSTTSSPPTWAARRRSQDLRERAARARHPPGQRHGAEPHGHRLALGDRASRLVRAARPQPVSRPTASTGPTCRTTGASASTSRTTTTTAATRRWCSSASTAGPATTRYIYHGNDGTSMPWNDTAQLDYLQARGARGGHPDHPARGAPASRSSASTPP